MRYLNLAGYIAIPIAYLVHLWIGKGHSWEPPTTFALAALGVIPLAHLMGEATEHLSARAGPTPGRASPSSDCSSTNSMNPIPSVKSSPPGS